MLVGVAGIGDLAHGRLQLDEIVSQIYPLADIQLALDDMHAGKLNRAVLTFA